MLGLNLAFGLLVGFSLGATGGGGAIFAVPMLVYGLGMTPREAVTVSLASVGVMSFVGFLERWRTQQIEIRTGLVFAAAGMLGAPVGSWLSHWIDDRVLLFLFAVLMVIVALRMWSRAAAEAEPAIRSTSGRGPDIDAPTCRRDEHGDLILTTRCTRLLVLVGVGTGVLSGLFGVSGGFVIVPALVLFSGMAMQRAIGTSLMVITLVSLSAIASHWTAGRTVPLQATSLFVGGGLAGLYLGTYVSRRLSGTALQKAFSVAIVLVAAFVIVRTTAAR